MIEWDDDANEFVEGLPLPPVMLPLARLDAQLRARRAGGERVCMETVQATARGYRRLLGAEAVALIERMQAGEDPNLPDEFFEHTDGHLWRIDLCPATYGACTAQKREMMRTACRAVREVLLQEDATGVMLSNARPPVMSHHMLRVAVIGCPNCCASPWFADVGIICRYRPSVAAGGCSGCGRCVEMCASGAVSLVEGAARIDVQRCDFCGGCATACPAGAIALPETGYQVVLGGTGARRPRLAETVIKWTDAAGVAAVLRRALRRYGREARPDVERSFHEFVAHCGVAALRGPDGETDAVTDL